MLMHCNGSRLLPDYPRPSSIDTTLRDEGNAAHWLAQECFEGRIDINVIRDDLKAYNGVLITPEMYEHVRGYLAELSPGQMEIATTWGVNGIFTINGRADHRNYSINVDTLYVDDLKYGYSIVEPENNWTLISHAIEWCITNNHYPAKTVFTIHQPRPYHPDGPTRSWEVNADQMVDLHVSAQETLTNPSDMLQTGLTCRSCPKLGNCPAAREANMNAIDMLETAFTDNLTNDQLSDELSLVEYGYKLMGKRLDALKDMATHRVMGGQPLKGYGLERTYRNKSWREGFTPEMAKMITGKDLTVSKMITPAQAKARGVPEFMINSMTDRVESGIKLIPVDLNKKMKSITSK